MSLSFTSCWQFPLKFKHFSPWLLFSQSTESVQNKLPAALWISSSFFPTYFSWDTKQNKPLGYLCAQRQTSNLLKSEPLLKAAAIHEQTWNQISERNFSYVTQINLLIATYVKPDKVVKRPPGRSSVVQRKLLLSRYEYPGTSWQSSGWDPTLLLQGVRVQSLVRELKSYMLCHAGKKWNANTWNHGACSHYTLNLLPTTIPPCWFSFQHPTWFIKMERGTTFTKAWRCEKSFICGNKSNN